jgi:hypothetical protein
MRIKNMTSPAGNKIANQFIAEENGVEYFQSYETVIAMRKPNGKITLDRGNWDYSNTTGKYRNQFLGETKTETQLKIKLGIHKLGDLN